MHTQTENLHDGETRARVYASCRLVFSGSLGHPFLFGTADPRTHGERLRLESYAFVAQLQPGTGEGQGSLATATGSDSEKLARQQTLATSGTEVPDKHERTEATTLLNTRLSGLG